MRVWLFWGRNLVAPSSYTKLVREVYRHRIYYCIGTVSRDFRIIPRIYVCVPVLEFGTCRICQGSNDPAHLLSITRAYSARINKV